jgi:hypothetical protein
VVGVEEDGAGDVYSKYGTTEDSGCAMLQRLSISTAGNRTVRAAFTTAQQGLRFNRCIHFVCKLVHRGVYFNF